MSGRTQLIAMATAVALACLPTAARAAADAAFLTGNELQSFCDANDARVAACVAYVAAIFEVIHSNPINGRSACLPPGVLVGQAVGVVKRWLDQHPEQRQLGAAGLVAQALSEAFPCRA